MDKNKILLFLYKKVKEQGKEIKELRNELSETQNIIVQYISEKEGGINAERSV